MNQHKPTTVFHNYFNTTPPFTFFILFILFMYLFIFDYT